MDKIQPDTASSQGNAFMVAPLIKYFEDLFILAFPDADSVVFKTDQKVLSLLFEDNVYPGFSGYVVFHGIGQEIHEEHFEQGGNKRVINRPVEGIFNIDFTILKDMAVGGKKIFYQFDQIQRQNFPFIHFALDPGKIQDAVDVVGKALRVLEHKSDIFKLLFTGKLMTEKSFEIKFEGRNGRFEFMGEIVDKGVLETIVMKRPEVVDEDNQNSRQNKTDQKGQNEDDNPSLGLEKLICIKMVTLDNVLQAGTHTNIPINVKKQRNRQGDRRDDKYKYGMNIRSGLFHDDR